MNRLVLIANNYFENGLSVTDAYAVAHLDISIETIVVLMPRWANKPDAQKYFAMKLAKETNERDAILAKY